MPVVSAEMPTGTVTLLFTDMEESTRLLTGLGSEAYQEVLATQRRLQRETFERWRGHEMGTEGDSFFIAFGSARDAVCACIEAQRALVSHPWPSGAPVRVRMGMHTGEPTVHEDNYVGLDVHLAARVAATAHGGQVVISESTRGLVTGQLGSQVSLRSLGGHRLKDIADVQHLHQVVAPGLPEEFPPLRSLGTKTNLPTPAYPLIRRDAELAELTGLLTRPGRRLHTLTGPGGSGKTRLAVAVAEKVADRFPDGVFFVPLAAVTQASIVWTTIAEALGLTGESKAPPTFFESIRDRRLLLVLDNLEQLGDAAKVVAELLDAAPQVAVLATSRRPLHLPGEQEYCVDPLSLPDPAATAPSVAEALRSGAVALFVELAQLVRPGFRLTDDNVAAVVAVCRRLDGLPLALELAAARTKLLSPRALLARLDQAWEPTASGHRPGRHQTLRATVGWSHDLLSPDLQVTFRRLGVFAQGADLEAAEAVTCAADGLEALTSLVDASLVKVDEGVQGVPRLRLLETVRRFAVERLEAAGELDAVRRGHAEHYLAVAEAAEQELRGPRLMWARGVLEADMANFRAALEWSLGDGADPADAERTAIGLRLCGALSFYWYTTGYVAEGREWAGRASALASAEQGPELGSVLHTFGILLLQQGEHQRGRDILAKALRIWRQVGDESEIAKELNSLGVAYRNLGDHARAQGLFEQSIATAQRIDHKQRLSAALTNLGVLEVDAHHPERAIELFRRAEAVDLERGDEWGVVADRLNQVGAQIEAGRIDDGLAMLRAVSAQALSLGDTDLTASVIEFFSICCGANGDPRRAARLSGAAAALREQAQIPLPEPDVAYFTRHFEPVRAALSTSEWDDEAANGRALTAAEALEVAQA